MRNLYPVVAGVALLVLALPAPAQLPPPGSPPLANPSAAPPDDDNGVGGPQWKFMIAHGYTTTDTQPYSGGDVFSDQLNSFGFGESSPPLPPPPYPPGYERW
jgi:hypothetical protein